MGKGQVSGPHDKKAGNRGVIGTEGWKGGGRRGLELQCQECLELSSSHIDILSS